ncbi:MAG: nucleotide exchange factor GrpE [Deltaproteobacteria bacterium]|nr:nucleotide exchange factor GrpE [Deltaproteobacteria bacterium]
MSDNPTHKHDPIPHLTKSQDEKDRAQDDEIKKLQEKFQQSQDESIKLKENLLYLRAEFDNFRKRHLKEKEDFFRFSNERILKQILTVADHLENACLHAQSADKENLLLGVTMTLNELKNILKQNGVEEIQDVGQPFDPHYHEAISQEISDKVKPGDIVSVHEKGYLYNNRLLRPAKVVVATVDKGKE